MSKLIRSIAIVLPQFHPIPENDEWWGKGFTEWTNVVKAKQLYEGHYQPHLPSDLGFYDLRLAEAREAQANLAREHGIHGFCYYHYWFNGKRLLNQPIDEILRLRKPDMPFMLCWANENWTRTWDGLDKEVLIKQNYNEKDDYAHIRWLCSNVFKDERYIKINDKPVFIVYRASLFPDIKETISRWRQIAIQEFGFKGLYLCGMESFNKENDPRINGFDAAIEFSPHQIINFPIPEKFLSIKNLFQNRKKKLRFSDYNKAVTGSIKRKLPNYKLFRSVTPRWDNTPRKGADGIIVKNATPEAYRYWLQKLLENFEPYSPEENFIFINAMNEWAEGNHLEPCILYGKKYLEATADVMNNFEN